MLNCKGYPGGSVVRNVSNVGDAGDSSSIPGLGKSPGGGMVTHSSILAWKNLMDRGALWVTVHGVAKS